MTLFKNCGWLFLLLVVLFALIVIIVVKLGVKALEEEYLKLVTQACDKTQYISYPGSLPVSTYASPYAYDVALFLGITCENVSSSNCSNLGTIPNPTGFALVDKLSGDLTAIRQSRKLFNVLTRPINCGQTMLGYVFKDDTNKRLLIAFTGTFYLSEWQKDFEFCQVRYDEFPKITDRLLVHEGFYKIYQTIQSQLLDIVGKYNGYQLIICGHSLGGTLTTFSALSLIARSPIVYTFGSPRVGNISFARVYNKLLPNAVRVFNTEDVVPYFPLPAGDGKEVYEHVGINVPFTVNTGNLVKNHLNTYTTDLPQ